MKNRLIVLWIILSLGSCQNSTTGESTRSEPDPSATQYLSNRAPLKQAAYLELPLGAIQPQGWLKEQLERMAKGLTGNLDSVYSAVVGDRNGWLGGDGDGWERGPYWIDGLLPLAYILEDSLLISKAKKWVDWTLDNQAPDGYIGPVPFEVEPAPEAGLQKGQRKDWWPKMVMLKVLQQYYSATQDPRVIDVLTNYFRYQLKELPDRPLDYETFWANRRGGDNLQAVYWLYNITGDEFLLELGDLIHKQTFPWTTVFLNDRDYEAAASPWSFFSMKSYPFDSSEIANMSLAKIGGIHTVNLAQGLKEPIVYYQKEPDTQYVASVKRALNDIKQFHGQVQGMYGGDEPLHGANPVQGIEFCAISESMYSLETMVKITGDMEFADLLERITYNALPAQASDDFNARQYFQAANQVEISDRMSTSFETHSHQGTDFVFGTVTGYPCCTTNMHQSWPKFVQNMFYATPDQGLAVLQYGPTAARVSVGDSVDLLITETTGYPFRETINFELALSGAATFPFHLRIPDWAHQASVHINGMQEEITIHDELAIINREWKNSDKITLRLPMNITTSQWYEFSTAVERGPLVYALKIEAEEKIKDRKDGYGEFSEFFARSDWNYALVPDQFEGDPSAIQVKEHPWDGSYPWNLTNAPISIELEGVKVPEWKATNGIPHFPSFWNGQKDGETEKIELVPYGCTTLRIAEFPTFSIK